MDRLTEDRWNGIYNEATKLAESHDAEWLEKAIAAVQLQEDRARELLQELSARKLAYSIEYGVKKAGDNALDILKRRQPVEPKPSDRFYNPW